MKANLLGAIATLALVAGASSAPAAIVDVTYTGTVTSIYDQTDIFKGAAVGSIFQITYRFDTTIGSTYSSPTENYASGGSYYHNTSPSLGATPTVNGVTGPAIVGNYQGEIYGYNDQPVYSPTEQHHWAYYSYDANNINTYNYVHSEISAIPSFFRGPKRNLKLAIRCKDSRITSNEARVRDFELPRKRSRHA